MASQQQQQWFHRRSKWIRRFLFGLLLILLESRQWTTVDVRVITSPEIDGSEPQASMEVRSDSSRSLDGSKDERAQPNDPQPNQTNLTPMIITLANLFTSQQSAANNTNDTCDDEGRSIPRFIDCMNQTSSFSPISLAMCEDLKTVESLTLVPLPIPTKAPKLQSRIHWHEQYLDVFWERAQAKNITIFQSARGKDWDPKVYLDSFRPIDSPSSMAVIRDAYADLKRGWVQTRCGKELIQFQRCTERDRSDPIVNTSTAHRFDRVVFVANLWPKNIYHGTVEQLPSLILIKDLIQATDIPIVISELGSEFFITVATQILDIPRSRFVTVLKNAVIYANVLYMPEPTPCLRLQPAEAFVANQAISEKIPTDSLMTPRTILLIRRRAPRRSLVNHDELETALRKALPQETFEVLDAHNLPAPGIPQFQMFARAKIIVGPHGAGFYGMLAAQPGSTTVVELLAYGRKFNLCFFRLSTSLGLEYHPLAMFPITSENAQYTANVSSVVNIVKEIVERQGKNKSTL